MRAVVKAAYYDRVQLRSYRVGDVVDFSAKRIEEVNASLPGTLEREPVKKAAAKPKE